MKNVNVLVQLPSTEAETLMCFGAIRPIVLSCSFPIVVDALTDSETCATLARDLGIFSKVILSDDLPGVVVESTKEYDIISTLEASMDEALEYQEEDKTDKIEELKDFMSEVNEDEIHGQQFNYIKTLAKNFATLIEELEIGWTFADSGVSLGELRPAVTASKKAIKEVKKTLGNTVEHPYAVIHIPDDGDLDVYIALSECFSDQVLFLYKGSCYLNVEELKDTAEYPITDTEVIALLVNPNCYCVFSDSWYAYVGWAQNKPLTICPVTPRDDAWWDLPQDTRCLLWDKDADVGFQGLLARLPSLLMIRVKG